MQRHRAHGRGRCGLRHALVARRVEALVADLAPPEPLRGGPATQPSPPALPPSPSPPPWPRLALPGFGPLPGFEALPAAPEVLAPAAGCPACARARASSCWTTSCL